MKTKIGEAVGCFWLMLIKYKILIMGACHAWPCVSVDFFACSSYTCIYPLGLFLRNFTAEWCVDKKKKKECSIIIYIWMILIKKVFYSWIMTFSSIWIELFHIICFFSSECLKSLLWYGQLPLIQILPSLPGLWVCKLQSCCIWHSKSFLWDGCWLSYGNAPYSGL